MPVDKIKVLGIVVARQSRPSRRTDTYDVALFADGYDGGEITRVKLHASITPKIGTRYDVTFERRDD